MFAPGVKFKLTLDMCNSLLFYMHNYVKFIFSRLSVEERYLPKNYYLLLYNNIFENRTEQTIQNLYNILNNYILEKHSDASSCNYHLTQVRCVCLQNLGYAREGTSDIYLKSVKDPEKVREHTMALFSYLLSYKQLYRLKCGDGYDAYLQERLSKLRNFMFDSVFIGFDELLSPTSVKNFSSLGYYNVSEFMRDLFKHFEDSSCSVYSGDLVKLYCSKLSGYKLLPCVFSIMTQSIGYAYPYNLLSILFHFDVNLVLSYYTYLCSEGIVTDFIDCLYHQLSPREYFVLWFRLKEGASYEFLAETLSVNRSRVGQIEVKALKKLRSYIHRRNLFDLKNVYSALMSNTHSALSCKHCSMHLADDSASTLELVRKYKTFFSM